ncbi:MAG: hypothetical protein LLF92_00670 [Planctomycetaceae bacterium]|nr:hypothetical protein [Planctomycetaceae bacterium]
MKKIISIIAAAIIFSSSTYAANYSGGSGTESDPYLIATAVDMNTIGLDANDWNKCFKLVADINMAEYTGTKYMIIGTDYYTPFTGTFDGNGHVIRNLTYITTIAVDYIGLFGFASNATIKNLGLENVNIDANDAYVGGLIGYQYGGTITNCYSTGVIAASSAGGLVGCQGGGTITNCYSTVKVTSSAIDYAYAGGLVAYQTSNTQTSESIITNSYSTGSVSASSGCYADAGGIVGEQAAGSITNCYSIGPVVSSSSSSSFASYAGGVAGYQWSGVITNSYSEGDVTSTALNSFAYAGGLLGMQYDQSIAEINKCYSTGTIFTNGEITYKGGFLGYYGGSGIITACFWDVNSSGISNGLGYGSSSGAVGKTTVDMQTQSTFTGWDFNTPVWMICGQDYPKLIWNTSTDIDDDKDVDFSDFAILAELWQADDCGFCNGADLTGDRKVNMYDLNIFVANWLKEEPIAEHVSNICIKYSYDYESLDSSTDTNYDFEFVIDTDDTVERIEFLTPAGNTYEITATPNEWADETGWFDVGGELNDDGGWEWWYEVEFFGAASLDNFGDGEYTITVYYKNGRSQQTTANFSIPGTNDPLPQPTQMPVITSFANGATLTSPITVTWQACTDHNANNIVLDIEDLATDDELEYEVDVAATGLGDAIQLNPGNYEVELDYRAAYGGPNNDGIYVFRCKYAESDYEITVEEPIAEHVYEIEICQGIVYASPDSSTDTMYDFEFEIYTDNTVERIEFLTPAGNTYEITETSNEWCYEAEFFDAASLDNFGDGEYVITVYYNNGRSQQTTANFSIPGTNNPLPQTTQIPIITSFANGATLVSPVTFTWQACIDPNAENIYLGIENQATDEELEYDLVLAATSLPNSVGLSSGGYMIDLSYETDYEIVNSDGIALYLCKYAESDYEITIE